MERGGSNGLAPARPETPDFPLDLGVVRFELRVRDGPVRKAGAGDLTQHAALVEVDLVKAPEVRGEVVTAAANDARVHQRRIVDDAGRLLVGSGSEGLRGADGVVHQPVGEPVVELSVLEVGR